MSWARAGPVQASSSSSYEKTRFGDFGDLVIRPYGHVEFSLSQMKNVMENEE